MVKSVAAECDDELGEATSDNVFGNMDMELDFVSRMKHFYILILF